MHINLNFPYLKIKMIEKIKSKLQHVIKMFSQYAELTWESRIEAFKSYAKKMNK